MAPGVPTPPEVELFCRTRLGEHEGDEVIALVERATGAPCPCKAGQSCPLMPLWTIRQEAV